MSIRYYLAESQPYVVFGDYSSIDAIKNSTNPPPKMTLLHYKGIHFVDILDRPQEERGVPTIHWKVRIYEPGGEIIVGWVAKEHVLIHNIELLFDGRFNSDRYSE